MLRATIAVCVILLFYTAPAKSQDALSTFMYLFVNDGIDVAHEYGNQYVMDDVFSGSVRGRKVVSVEKSCVFQTKLDGTDSSSSSGVPLQIVETKRWDFNKAYFDETKTEKFLDGSVRITIPGEKGLTYWSEVCLSDARSCDWGSGTRGEHLFDNEVLAIADQIERHVKALKYFVQKFCPGTKRKSAF